MIKTVFEAAREGGYANLMSSSDGHRPSLAHRLVDTSRVPQDVRVSYYLWVLDVVLSIISALYVVFVGGGPVIAGVIGFVFALLLAVLYLYCAVRMKEGRPWARMVLTLLASLSAIALIGSIVQGMFGLSLLGPIIAVFAAVLMWSRNANPWFRQRR
ncbi:hypothetical protein GCM10027562_17420 [Arthrobacter pigmenti]